MSEYISREDVRRMILKYRADNPKKQTVWAMVISDMLRDLKEIPTADVQPVNQWISCQDKMPEDNTSVLFVYVSKNGIKSVHYGYHQTVKGLGSSWAKLSGGWQYCDDDITHWQPLPEPPKDGDTECQ